MESSRNLLRSSVLLALFYVSSGFNITSNTTVVHQKDDANIAVILPVVIVIAVVLIIIGIIVVKRYYFGLDDTKPNELSYLGLDVTKPKKLKTVDIFADSIIENGYISKGGKSKTTGTTATPSSEVNVGMPTDPGLKIPEYKMTAKHPRGLAVIIGIDVFDHANLCPLPQVKKDKAMVAAMFKKLSFEIRMCVVTKKKQIVEFLKKISAGVNSKYDCFACYISSHGLENHVSCQDDDCNTDQGRINIQDMIRLFLNDACKGLAGKPKLFFFDVCLGEKTVEEYISKGHGEKFSSELDKKNALDHTLSVFSTIHGFVSWCQDDGSFFTKALTHVINQSNGGHDIIEIVYAICNKMEEDSKKKPIQIPTYQTHLCKKLRLKKKLK